MHARTPLLALLLASCTALPAHALDVHIANTSKSEILSVFLAGLTDDGHKMSMLNFMQSRPGETVDCGNETLKEIQTIALDYGRGRIVLKDPAPLKDKNELKLVLSFDEQGKPELAVEGGEKLAIDVTDLRFAQDAPGAVDVAELAKAATRGDVHQLAKDTPGVFDDPVTGECILPVRAGGAVWTGVVSFAFGKSEDRAVARLRLMQEIGDNGLDKLENVFEALMGGMNLHPISLRADPTVLAFCGPGTSRALETDVARVRFAEMASDKGLFSDPQKPASMQGLLVGEKAYAQCVKDSGKKDAKAGEAKSDEAKSGEAKSDEAKSGEAKAGEAKSDEAKAGEAKAGEAKAGEAQPAPAAAEAQQEKEPGALVRRTNASLVIVELLKDSSKQIKQEMENQGAGNPS